MQLIGARLFELRPGYCAIEAPFREDLTQQQRLCACGIIGAIVDSGAVTPFYAFSGRRERADRRIQLNLLAPAAGDASSRKPSRQARTNARHHPRRGLRGTDGKRTLCAIMQQTLIVLAGKADA